MASRVYEKIERADLISPGWAVLASRLPRYLRFAVVAWVGTIWTARLGFFYQAKQTSVAAIREANSASWPRAWQLFWGTQCQSVQSLIDFSHLNGLLPDDVRRFARNKAHFRNIEVLEASVSGQRPVILLLASFSLHYLGLVTESSTKLVDTVAVKVVQPSAALLPLNEMGFYEKLSAASSRVISGIYADHAAVAVHVGRALKKREIVAMRIDSLPVKTASYVIADFMGNQATFPLSVLELAAKFGADLIPFFVQKDGNGFVTSFGEPVRLNATPGNSDYTNAANQIYAQMAERILAAPDAYLAWHAVHEKWRMATELQVAMIST